jgi:hypothetical protein
LQEDIDGGLSDGDGFFWCHEDCLGFGVLGRRIPRVSIAHI